MEDGTGRGNISPQKDHFSGRLGGAVG